MRKASWKDTTDFLFLLESHVSWHSGAVMQWWHPEARGTVVSTWNSSRYEDWRSQSELILFVCLVLEHWNTAGHKPGSRCHIPRPLIGQSQSMLASDWLTRDPGPPGRGHESHHLIMNFISVIILIQITLGHDPVSSSPAWKVTHETKHLQIMNWKKNFCCVHYQ